MIYGRIKSVVEQINWDFKLGKVVKLVAKAHVKYADFTVKLTACETETATALAKLVA